MGTETLCEVPGCTLPALITRRMSSGDVVRVCGLPHVSDDWSCLSAPLHPEEGQ